MVSFGKLTKAGINIDELLKRLMGNESLVRVFIKKFTEDKTFSSLIEAFDANEARKAEMASHTLKGMAGNLSLTGLFELFSEQVELIRSGNMAKAGEMMPEISAAFESTLTLMKEWLEET